MTIILFIVPFLVDCLLPLKLSDTSTDKTDEDYSKFYSPLSMPILYFYEKIFSIKTKDCKNILGVMMDKEGKQLEFQLFFICFAIGCGVATAGRGARVGGRDMRHATGDGSG